MQLRTTAVMAMTAIALAGCSKKGDDKAKAQEPVQGHFTITPPKLPDDPEARKAAQKQLVERMITDTSLPLDMIEGEAYRRGVTLTPEQIARKKAQKLTATPPRPQEEPATAPDGTTTPAADAVAAKTN